MKEWYKQGLISDYILENKNGIKIKEREQDEKKERINKLPWQTLMKGRKEYNKKGK
jgi:hypothetical protein